MIKYSLLSIFLVLSNSLFGQYFDYVSLGFNTVKTTSMSGEMIEMFHYFNDPAFSKLRINAGYNILQTERSHRIQQGNNFYDGVMIGPFMHAGAFFYYKDSEGYRFDGRTEIYRITNGRLRHVQWGDYTSNRIVYTDAGITVTMRGRNRNDQYLIEFSNIPEEQLHSMFLNYLSDTIETIIGTRNQPDYVIINNVTNSLKRVTKTELEFFLDVLLKRHGYTSMPYKLLALNNRELRLLEIIQRELADKYFKINGYYRTNDSTPVHRFPFTESEIISVIDEGEWVQVMEEGEPGSIDGLTSVWVRIILKDNSEGWCFGGYLNF